MVACRSQQRDRQADKVSGEAPDQRQNVAAFCSSGVHKLAPNPLSRTADSKFRMTATVQHWAYGKPFGGAAETGGRRVSCSKARVC